jgi:serine/threonine protein phosphatase PrpC
LRLLGRKIKPKSDNSLPESFQDGQPIVVKAALSQSVGITRDHMEDAALCLVLQQGSCEQNHRIGLFAAADGMGGHTNGELASSTAIQNFVETLDPVKLGDRESFDPDEIQVTLEQAFIVAQQAVLDTVKGGGSTLTAALVIDRDLYFAHVGDSRLYLVAEQGHAKVLTRDHSLVQRLVDLGQISPDEAEIHPQKNVLYRALGQTDGFKVDVGYQQLEKPGHLVVCTDGLWGLVGEKKLLEIVRENTQIENRAERLCKLANDAGGTDNITVIVVDFF